MCSRKLLRENDNVMRPNYRSVTTFCTASVNNVMTFCAYKSDRNIFYKQFNFRLAPQTFGLVTSSNSLPEGQPHLFIFVSPCFVFCFRQKHRHWAIHKLIFTREIRIRRSCSSFAFFCKQMGSCVSSNKSPFCLHV